jgi:hypothetical protein
MAKQKTFWCAQREDGSFYEPSISSTKSEVIDKVSRKLWNSFFRRKLGWKIVEVAVKVTAV